MKSRVKITARDIAITGMMIATIEVAKNALAFAWWVSGIPFDIVHCLSNFVICLVLFKPLSRGLSRIRL